MSDIGPVEQWIATQIKQVRTYTFNEMLDFARAHDAEDAALRAALTKINDIRDSIIGAQTVNWSAHVYPLVAALQEAGYEGLGYEESRESVAAALKERAAKDEALRQAGEALREAASDLHYLIPNHVGPLTSCDGVRCSRNNAALAAIDALEVTA